MRHISPTQTDADSPDYRGEHEAPCAGSGTPIWDLCGEAEIYPEDVYGPDALRMYTDGDDESSRESLSVLKAIKGSPGALVTIYRAVPYAPSTQERLDELASQKRAYLRRGESPPNPMRYTGSQWYDWACDQEDELRASPAVAASFPSVIKTGDWVTLSRSYAVKHGKSNLKNEYKILSSKVPASQVFCDGNSLNEMGYWGPEIKLKVRLKSPGL